MARCRKWAGVPVRQFSFQPPDFRSQLSQLLLRGMQASSCLRIAGTASRALYGSSERDHLGPPVRKTRR